MTTERVAPWKTLTTDDLRRDSVSRIQRAAVYVVLQGEDVARTHRELTEIVPARAAWPTSTGPSTRLAPALTACTNTCRPSAPCGEMRAAANRWVAVLVDLAGMLAHQPWATLRSRRRCLRGHQPAWAQRVAKRPDHHGRPWPTGNGQGADVPGVRRRRGTPAGGRDHDRARHAAPVHAQPRDSGARMGLAPSGNARAYGPDDEPLVRMRNTTILPGEHTLRR